MAKKAASDKASNGAMLRAPAEATVIRPLVKALTTTGSGRLELIRDACERGLFHDLRLVKPALDAIDDVYGQIADLVAEKVLPLYGKAILPELRAKFDPKGRGGHPRRLQLMHRLDPTGTRILVKEALAAGSKEVKIVAIECLDREDLSYLLEQAKATVKDVREAAYRVLANVDHHDAVKVLRKAIDDDFDVAARALRFRCNRKVLDLIISKAASYIIYALDFTKKNEKRLLSVLMERALSLLYCLSGRHDKKSETFLVKIFGLRKELEKIKGDTTCGWEVNQKVLYLMSAGSKNLQTTLAQAHASLPNEKLVFSFDAAHQALSREQVFDMFSPYLTAKVDEKKKLRDPAWARREAMIHVFEDYPYDRWPSGYSKSALDPRWLDVGVALRNLLLVRLLGRPGHAPAEAFLKKTFDAVLKKSKDFSECHEALAAMVKCCHPQATDAFIAVFEMHRKKADHYIDFCAPLIPLLPKSAVPRLEALLPSLSEKMADTMIDYLQQLRDKK